MMTKRIDLGDVLVVLGLLLLGVGLGGYDWRLALVVCGAVLLVVGLWAAARPSTARLSSPKSGSGGGGPSTRSGGGG